MQLEPGTLSMTNSGKKTISTTHNTSTLWQRIAIDLYCVINRCRQLSLGGAKAMLNTEVIKTRWHILKLLAPAALSSLFFIASASPAWSAALTWVGDSGDNDFNTAANWSPAQQPTASDSCIINSTNNRQPSILTNVTCGSLSLGSGASVMTLTFTATKNLNITGDVTIGANGRIAPSATPTGTFTIGGNWSDAIGTTNFTDGANLTLTYTFTGTTKTIITDESFYKINIDGDISLGSDIAIDNSLIITNLKTLTQGANTITLNGTTFTINGTYSHSCASTLVINGSLNMANNQHYPNAITNSGGDIAIGNPAYLDCDVTINSGGTLDIQSNLYLEGDWINNGGTIIVTPGTVTMTGVGKQIKGTASTVFNDLNIGDGAGDSITSANDITVNGILTITAGATFTLASGKNITTAKNVNLDGTMDVSGTSTWNHATGNQEIAVASGALLNVQGTDNSNRVTMTRIGASGYWDMVVNGGLDMQYVDISYTGSSTTAAGIAINTPNAQTLSLDDVSISNSEDLNNAVMMVYNSPQTIAASGMTFDSATYSVAGGDVNVEAQQGTINFNFYGGNYSGEDRDNDNGGTVAWLTGITGVVYTDEGTTTIADGTTVRLLINGISAGTDTTTGGAYSIIPVSINANDTLLVYIDNDDGNANDGTTVTVSDGTSLANLDIYVDHLITRHDNAGSLTNALMKTALEPYSDTEILYWVDGSNNLTVTGTNTELYVPTAYTYIPAGNVETGHVQIEGAWIATGAETCTVSGDWTNNNIYTAATSTVTLKGTAQTIYGSTTFYNLTKSITTADTLTFQDSQTTTIAAGGIATLTGTSSNILNLRSATPGTQWLFNVSGSSSVAYVDVNDSNALGGNAVYAYYSTDDTVPSNNDNWFFPGLQLVKQVWDETGANCLASAPSDGNCNSGATSIITPATGKITFLIFIRNAMPVDATDVRFQDLINDTEFTYQTGTLKRSPNDGSAPANDATLATIMGAATIVQTDAFDGDTQVDEFSGIDTGTSPDGLQIGGAGGVGQNDTLTIPPKKTFAIRFEAVKN